MKKPAAQEIRQGAMSRLGASIALAPMRAFSQTHSENFRPEPMH
jgi:hypothetical protein